MAEAVKPKHGGIFSVVLQYGGNFLAVGVFHFSAVTMAEAVKTKTWRYFFGGVMQYGSNFLAMSGFSFSAVT